MLSPCQKPTHDMPIKQRKSMFRASRALFSRFPLDILSQVFHLSISWKHILDMLSPARNLLSMCLKIVVLEVYERLYGRANTQGR